MTMTDLDRLEELLAKAKDAQHTLSMPGEPAYQIEQEWKRLTEANLQKSAAQALPALITELRQLREIVREAGEALEPFASKPTVEEILKGGVGGGFPANTTPEERIEIIAIRKERDTMNILAARTLHNKIKEVMG